MMGKNIFQSTLLTVLFAVLLSLLTPCLYICSLKWVTMAENWTRPTTYSERLSKQILTIPV